MRSSLALVAFAAVVSLLAACGKTPAPADASAAKPGAAGPTAPQAAATAASAPVLLVAPEDLRTLSPSLIAGGPVVTGQLQPERRADLRSEVSAVVLQVLKENGQAVRQGELLVRLDDTAIRDSLNSAEESVRAVSQAFEQAERQVQRLKTLQAQGMTSMQALEDAEVRRNNAQSDLVAARARAVSARQQLRRTEVRAPFDGVVSERKASAGDTAAVGKELLKVIDPASMRFEGLVSADRMHEVKPGQNVRFRVNGFPDVEFAGRVQRLDATANATTRQVEVVVSFADPAAAPRVAGLFAEGRVETGGTQQLMLPEGTVIRSGDAAHAWKVGDGVVNKVALKLGEREPRTGEFPVLSGLAAGDRVLRAPVGTLVDGQKFEYTKPAATAAAMPGAPASR
jgi:membrane fusion protein, multidrug efflux system